MLLGIDVGTGGTRAVLIDRMGKVLASFASEHAPIRSEHIGWAEQDPEDWWRAAREAISGAMAASGGGWGGGAEGAGFPVGGRRGFFGGREFCARINGAGAGATGLGGGTRGGGGAGDQGAGAVGMGILAAGSVSATIGTSGVVFAATAEPTKDPKGRIHTFCHAVPGVWHVMGVTQSAGLSFQWFRNTFCAGQNYD